MQRYLDKLGRYRREREVIVAELTEAGRSPTPPADWQPARALRKRRYGSRYTMNNRGDYVPAGRGAPGGRLIPSRALPARHATDLFRNGGA